jgi:hypothetical protein
MIPSDEQKAPPPAQLEDDLVWGIPAIGKVINRTPRQTFNLIKTEQIPTGKAGKSRFARRSALRARFATPA